MLQTVKSKIVSIFYSVAEKQRKANHIHNFKLIILRKVWTHYFSFTVTIQVSDGIPKTFCRRVKCKFEPPNISSAYRLYDCNRV